MYPELKKFREKLNNAGPWIVGESFLQGVCIYFLFFCIYASLNQFDEDYNNKIPWLIEFLFMINFIFQFYYLNKNLKLGLKNERDQIKSIINIEDIKKSLLPILFIRLQLRFTFLLRIPYLFLIYKLLPLPSLYKANLIETIIIYILHLMFLYYDYLSYKDKINKITRKALPLKANEIYSDSGKNINDLREDISDKNKNINEFDSHNLIRKLLRKNKL